MTRSARHATVVLCLFAAMTTPTPARAAGSSEDRVVQGICARFEVLSTDKTAQCKVLVRKIDERGALILVAESSTRGIPLFLKERQEQAFGENGTTRKFVYRIDGVVLPEVPGRVLLVDGTCSELIGGPASIDGKPGESYSIECAGKFGDGRSFALGFVGSAQ